MGQFITRAHISSPCSWLIERAHFKNKTMPAAFYGHNWPSTTIYYPMRLNSPWAPNRLHCFIHCIIRQGYFGFVLLCTLHRCRFDPETLLLQPKHSTPAGLGESDQCDRRKQKSGIREASAETSVESTHMEASVKASLEASAEASVETSADWNVAKTDVE